MDAEPITRQRVDELLRFLPRFANPDERLDPQWHGFDDPPDEDGASAMPYPSYPPEVEEFFELAGQPCWCDYGYATAGAEELVHNDAAIAVASLAQIKTMLTYCVRGERFCDGHWGAMIREGRVGAILGRLQELRDTLVQ